MLTARPSRFERDLAPSLGEDRGRETLLDPSFLAFKGEILRSVLAA